MANVYHNDLLAPFLALPQGDKIQAECSSHLFIFHIPYLILHQQQMSGLMATAGFVQRLPSVFLFVQGRDLADPASRP